MTVKQLCAQRGYTAERSHLWRVTLQPPALPVTPPTPVCVEPSHWS